MVLSIGRDLCDCCGRDLSTIKSYFLLDPEDEYNYNAKKRMVRGDIYTKADVPIQCRMYKLKFGEKRVCGLCFSLVLFDITGELYGPEDFLALEDFKINHINKLFSEMTLEELKARKKKFDDATAEYETIKAEAEAKAEEEWLRSLK